MASELGTVTVKAQGVSVGRVIIAAQGAVEAARFTDDDERTLYCNHLADTIGEHVRQGLLTFRANRATISDVQRAQEIDQARRGAQAT